MNTRRLLALALVGATLLAACGGGDSGTVAGGATTTAASAAKLHRIVSLSPTATEILFAIGAGDQVIAVDDQSNYPADAPKTKLSGYQPNVEAIAKYDPDVVVSSSGDPALVKGLAKVGINVVVEKAAVELADVYTQIRELGAKTGHTVAASKLVDSMKSKITAIAAHAKGRKALTAYWELDPTYYSATSSTFIGKILGLANVTSIADTAKADVPDYPQLSSEFIVSANPDLVFAADTKCCQQDAAKIAARPGWGSMTALKRGNVVALDDDIASRWGPRVVQLLQVVDEAAAKAAA